MIVLRTITPPTPADRLREWREQYDRLPEEMKGGVHHFDFRPKREPADPDAYLLRCA